MNERQQEWDFDAIGELPPSAADELPHEALQVIGALSILCRGRAAAHTAAEIAAHLGWTGSDPGRRVRNLISLYIGSFPFLVCAAGGDGYFIPDDPAAQLSYERRSLYSRLRCIARRIHDQDQQASRHGLVRQGAGPAAGYVPRQARSIAQCA